MDLARKTIKKKKSLSQKKKTAEPISIAGIANSVGRPGEVTIVQITRESSDGVPLEGRIIKKLLHPKQDAVRKILKKSKVDSYMLLGTESADDEHP